MAGFLTDEWFLLARELTASMPACPGASAVVQHVVSGAPGGKVAFVVEVSDGQVVALEAGKRPGATCTCTWTAADARAVLDGTLDAEVAFMQGRLKVEGDYVVWLDTLHPVRVAPGARAALAAIAAVTD